MANLRGSTYQALVNLCNGKARTIGNNTVASHMYGDTVEIRLHGHKIVELYDDGSVAFCMAGHPTKTTRDRINSFLPPGYLVFQKNRMQYLTRRTPQGGSETVEMSDSFWYGTQHGNKPLTARMVLDRSK